tara:strand:+ start:876 stop:1229 length:354 start_codon:yes stop_codon:yes gene_type:complete
MKLNELKKIVKTAVKEAIQEEIKDILLEAVKGNKQVVNENLNSYSAPIKPPTAGPRKSPEELRASYANILGETAASFNSSNVSQPLRVTSTDTTSPNGQLPAGEVGMDQIMGLMNSQ